MTEQPAQNDFIQETIEFWAKRTGERISREDAKQMIENVAGFFAVLNEWDRKSKIDELHLKGNSPMVSSVGKSDLTR